MVKLQDIAQRANVSISTVSNVLNGKHKASEDTVKRVMDAARALNYLPNNAASSLRTNCSFTVGVLIDQLHSMYRVQELSAIEQVLSAAGYQVLISTVNHGDTQTVRKAIASFLSQRVDGIINTSVSIDYFSEFKHSGTPILHLAHIESDEMNQIYVDEATGGRLVGEYLVRKQLLPVLCFNVKQENGYSVRINHCIRAVSQSMEQSDDIAGVITIDKGNFQCGYQGTLAALSAGKKFRSVFASNDVVAASVVRALKENGYRVPSDIAVIGFDNSQLSKMFLPQLTTVDMRARDLGKMGADRILSMMQNDQTDSCVTVLQPLLIPRESS